ncbi:MULTISPECIES: LacI family DNA-binding transcriptional regulator [unclassified Gilliamella]|uniref:LacI family DNA-binding transcriptional regulator n=1 Tax=unclassified Gilliamella TaxID=2685620 RepID=UPI00226AC00B|nr:MULTISPECIES: LacI family DNA-binding transcriptional regulator [unclassified Gilliamella]MCX8586079.1 LacI family DNA-binding transcriptional regulator [Gilliamella sp. B3562]MCX8663382.1 LacI family DNA-binding transcriptional regulator [Gilliamella sp. B2911]MCX8686219.1 LacI family DNA-binding transcriptional regulator [Gilliamella sp. B2864]
MVDIRDVAKHAGVSVSTVSNVLNGRIDQMRKETLNRIEESIKKLKYHPNKLAQQLKTGHVKMIGILVPSIMNPNFAALVNNIESIAKEKYGYQVLLANTSRQDKQEKLFLNDLLSFGVKGVIVVSSSIEKKHFISAINKGMVMVNYDGLTSEEEHKKILIDSISMDNFQAGKLAADFLLQQGCKNIVFATIKGNITSRNNKVLGFLDSLKNAGLSTKNRIIEGTAQFAYGDSELADLGKLIATKIIKNRKTLPDGIVAINDMLAIGIISELTRLGIKIPQDISVIGIDNMFLDTLFSPSLTSIAAPLVDMATLMVDRLVAMLNGDKIEPGEFLFKPYLVKRESVISIN